eukprot:4069846-Heterocapsa_arctica.AAC.1
MGPADALWAESQAHPRSEDESAESASHEVIEPPGSPPVESSPPGPEDVSAESASPEISPTDGSAPPEPSDRPGSAPPPEPVAYVR